MTKRRKSFNAKVQFIIATYNCRTLAGRVQMTNLIKGLRAAHIDMCMIQEPRWSGVFTIDEYTIIIRRQTGIIIKTALTHHIQWQFLEETDCRIMTVHVPRMGYSFQNGYAPVDRTDKIERKEDQKSFWGIWGITYTNLTESSPYPTITGGDFNARISAPVVIDTQPAIESVEESIDTWLNHNGQQLLDFTAQHAASILNWEGKRALAEESDATYRNKNTSSIIDYLVMERTWMHTTSKHTRCIQLKPHKSDHRAVTLRCIHPTTHSTWHQGHDTPQQPQPRPEEPIERNAIDEEYIAIMDQIWNDHQQSKPAEEEQADLPLPPTRIEDEDLKWADEEAEAIFKMKMDDYREDFAEYIAMRMTNHETHHITRLIHQLNRPTQSKIRKGSSTKAKEEMSALFRKLLSPTIPMQARLEQLPYRPSPPQAAPRKKALGLPTHIYVDGSFDKDDPDGNMGCGVVVISPWRDKPEYYAFKCRDNGRTKSNNRAELAATVFAIQMCDTLIIHSDSLVTVATANEIGLHAQSDFMNLEHTDLWRVLARQIREKNIQIVHMAAHEGYNPEMTGKYQTSSCDSWHNECADKLAKMGRLLPDFQVRNLEHDDTLWWNVEPSSYNEKQLIQRMLQQWKYRPIAECEDMYSEEPLPHTHIPQYDFDMAELTVALAQLKNHKAGGYEETLINTDVVKAMKTPTQQRLLDFFNHLLRQQKIPQRWLQSLLVMIPKDKTKSMDKDNVRGIALQCIIAKVLHRIIINRLWRTDIDTVQIGFTRTLSTEVGIRALDQLIWEARNFRRNIHIGFVDLHKAFDCLPRNVLAQIAAMYGLSGKVADLLFLMYNEKIHIVLDDDHTEPSFPATQGTQQGAISSPLLFNMAMDLVIRNVTPFISSKLIIYADDIAMVARDRTSLEHDMRILTDTLARLNLHLSGKKTQTLDIEVDSGYTENPTQNSKMGQASMHTKRNIHRNQHPDCLQAEFARIPHGYALIIPEAKDNITKALGCPIRTCSHTNPDLSLFQRHCKHHCHFKKVIYDDPTQPKIHPFTIVQMTDNRPDLPYYIWSKDSSTAEHTFKIGTNDIESTNSYKHLGVWVTGKGAQTAIDVRIQQARKAFYKVGLKLWQGDSLTIAQKRMLYRSYVEPILMYGMAAITLTAGQESQLNECYMNQLRIISGYHPFEIPEHPGIFDHFEDSFIRQAMHMPTMQDLLFQGRARIYRTITSLAIKGHKTAIEAKENPMDIYLKGKQPTSWWGRFEIAMMCRGIDPTWATHPGQWKARTKAKAEDY